MPSLHRRVLLHALAAIAASPVAVQSQPVRGEEAPSVMASFSILADMVRELVPSDFQVRSLVGPDADAHVFEPTPRDGQRLARTDLMVVNGLGFEGWIDRLIEVSDYRGPVVVATHGIKPRDEDNHGVDPHAWQDLRQADRYVVNLSAALAERWPTRRAEFEARVTDYRARIERLDRQVRQQLELIPRERRRVLTSHDSFGYFGASYGVDFLSPQGWNPHGEPSASAVARLIRQIRSTRVRAIFIENISDARLMSRLAREAGSYVGGTLYSDALSVGRPADTYLNLFAHNAGALISALSAAP